MGEYYIGQYRDHYAIFDSMGRVQTQYDTHAEAKADLDSYNKTGKPLPESTVMNEGLVMWGLFGVVIGISALYNRIDEAKRKRQNKKNKSNSSDNTIGITEKEINELVRQTKALKSDIITKQRSSSLYKTLYQYMTKWNTDDYVNAVKALKSGKAIDLGLDFRTDVYYSFVEFFDLSNDDFTKQLNDPNDDDEAEKLEVKYESESFEEMKKHLTSLGFDLTKAIDKRYYSSKKYPDLIIRYADGDDGTGIIIEPKCTLGADTFKLITEEESKKLNEDHSEISNDPEMEKLLALAGCTIEDLDTINNEEDIELDDDDPIDANTSREIDAVMDESVTEYLLEGFFNFKKKKEKDIQVENVSPDEIKKLPVNFKKAYDGWYFYLPFTDSEVSIDDLAKVSTKIRRVCNVNFGIDVYPTKFMVCNAKDMIKEFRTKEFFSEQFVKANGSILLFDYDWLSSGSSKYISTLKTNLGMRYFYDVINNSMYRYVEAMHYLDNISMEDAINTDKYYPVSYIDKKGIMEIYNYHNANTQKYMKKQNESVVEDMGDLDFIMESIFMDIDH